MAARPAGGAALAVSSSGEAQGLSQKPRLPAQKVTLEPREFGRDSSRSWEEGSVSRISPSKRRATGTTCSGRGRCKETRPPGTCLWAVGWEGTAPHPQQGADTKECECVRVRVCRGRGLGPASLAGWLWVPHSASLSCCLLPRLGKGGKGLLCQGAREGMRTACVRKASLTPPFPPHRTSQGDREPGRASGCWLHTPPCTPL